MDPYTIAVHVIYHSQEQTQHLPRKLHSRVNEAVYNADSSLHSPVNAPCSISDPEVWVGLAGVAPALGQK